MLVTLHRGQLKYFRAKARKAYPKEILAVLVGRQVHSGLIEVHRFYYPLLKVSTDQEVKTEYFVSDFIDKDEGLKVVGDIHSHPNYPAVMSPSDHQCHRKGDNKISAILEVPKVGKSRLIIWRDGTPLPCELDFFKD
jgi:proteasome lid subunit RPN8/RPN11